MSTEETHYGLLRLYNEELFVQWRTSREITRYGEETLRTDHELEPVREVTIPVGGLAGAVVRRMWHRGWRRNVLVLTAADLRAFDDLTGKDGVPGLLMKHPAELVLELRKSDVDRARTFTSQLSVAVSEAMLRSFEADHESHPISNDHSTMDIGSDVSEAASDLPEREGKRISLTYHLSSDPMDPRSRQPRCRGNAEIRAM
jgi:hypothetical protein